MSRLVPCQLATICVPWEAQGVLQEAAFRRQIRHHLAHGVHNLYLFGTAGEGYAVTNRQFTQLAEIFTEELRGQPGIHQLGLIGLSVGQVRERLEIGLALGFREFQLSLPSFGALTDRELAIFARDTLGAYPDCRFLYYNTIRGLRVLNPAELGRLASEYPNLVATKSGGHPVANLLTLFEACPQVCHFVTELDYASACLLGHPCGLLVSISAIHLPRSGAYFRAGQTGDFAKLRHDLYELHAIRAQVHKTVAQAGGHMDGTYDKLYARLSDATFPLTMLSPYLGPSEADFDRFGAWLATHHPNWLLTEEPR